MCIRDRFSDLLLGHGFMLASRPVEGMESVLSREGMYLYRLPGARWGLVVPQRDVYKRQVHGGGEAGLHFAELGFREVGPHPFGMVQGKVVNGFLPVSYTHL